MAKCSIIIATLPERKIFLEEAINSAQSQTVECEVIIEDGTDGAAVALNRAAKRSTGDFIFNLDDDDFIPENCIQRLIEEIADNDVIFSDLMLYDGTYKPMKQGFYGYEFLKNHNTMPGVLMTTRKAWEKVPFVEELRTGYDYERNLRFCEAGLKIKYLPEYLYFYRVHDKQIQKTLSEEQTQNNLDSKSKRA